MRSLQRVTADTARKRLAGMKLARTMAVVLLALAGFMISAPPASAAGCYGQSCVGHDPYRRACPISATATGEAWVDGVVVATVWNRYSRECNANWSEGQLTPAGFNRGYRFFLRVGTTAPGGDYQEMCVPGEDDTGQQIEPCPSNYPEGGESRSGKTWTDMVNGTNKTWSYVHVFDPWNNWLADGYTCDASGC